MPTKSKSRISKFGLNKRKGFKFRWWMGVIIAIIIAVVGIVVVRLSLAGNVAIYSVANNNVGGQCRAFPTVGPGYDDRKYTSEPQACDMSPGGYVEAADGDYFAWNGDTTVQVCWYYYSSDRNTKRVTVEIVLDGSQIAVQPNNVLSTPGTGYACITKAIPKGSGSAPIYRIAADSSNPSNVAFARATRQVISTSNPSPQPPPGPPPAPPPPQCGQTSTAPCTFNNVDGTSGSTTITSVCGYSAVGPYASLCPGNANQWQYVGLKSSFTGNWEQNRVKGVTHEHDVGYWKYGGLCAVKSHVISNPMLPKWTEPPVHFYLVGCPSGQDILNFKRENYKPPQGIGQIYITKYGPRGPIPPDGTKIANRSTVPGNTNVCVKNRRNETFFCGNGNPLSMEGILTADNPYTVYFTTPSGWRLTRILINGRNSEASGDSVKFNVDINQTKFVDLYFDEKR